MKTRGEQPTTVDEAVDQIIDELDLQDRTLISNLAEYDLKPLQMVMGLYIKELFDKWTFNEELRQSCKEESDEEDIMMPMRLLLSTRGSGRD